MTYLEDCKVFQDGVHHILLWQVFELEYEVNHVFTHRRAVNSVDKSAILKPSVFRFHFLHYLLAKRTNLSRTCDGHVFITLVSETKIFSS